MTHRYHSRAAWCLLPLLLLVSNAQAQGATVPCFGGDEPFTAETMPPLDLDSGRPCRLPTAAERAAHRGDYPPGSAETNVGQTFPAPAAQGWNGQGAGNASRNGSSGGGQSFGGQGSGGIQGGTFGNKNGGQRNGSGIGGFGNSGNTNSYGSNRSSGSAPFPTGNYNTAPTTPAAPTGYESYGGSSSEPTGYESYATPTN